MIPADVASRIRLANDLVSQPVASSQKLADVLSDFVPGQRVMATIQALLPNGTYRAMIAQRDITLALPFAAKAGDSLELEIVESNGKLALAIAAGARPATTEADDNTSVATRLTTTGRLIADLLAGMDKEGGRRPQPAPLNNAQPVVTQFPENSADLVPALKTALARSGMFYEAHQARWVQGKMPVETLLQEPQGRLSPAAHAVQSGVDTPPPSQTQASSSSAASQNQNATSPAASAVRVSMGQVIAPDLTPLVQQQLEALATQTYVWQGQIWPGQNMNWEIIEEESSRQGQEENTATRWTTRLKLQLPTLGGVEATLRLAGGQNVEISLRTETPETRQKLSAANQPLRRQFEAVGIHLQALSVAHHDNDGT